MDDNGNPVQNKSSTLSTTITFNVRVIPGVYPKPASSAALITVLSLPVVTATTNNTGTITFNNLAAGQEHTIKIVAVDSQDNVDPTPATFSWTVTQQSPPNNNGGNGGSFTGGNGGKGGSAIAHSGNANGGTGGNGGSDGISNMPMFSSIP